jgi:hypothetical protein
MLMRFCGFGIGHKATHFATRKLEEEVREAFGLDDEATEEDDDEASDCELEGEVGDGGFVEDDNGDSEEDSDLDSNIEEDSEDEDDEESDIDCEDEHVLGYAVLQ